MRESDLLQAQEALQTLSNNKYSKESITKSEKVKQDPILELEHIIGYNGQSCKDLQWSKFGDEKAIIFSTGGTLVSMDIKTNKQRFFFGHSESICCFCVSSDGQYIASGQEGENPIIRIWEYDSGACIRII